jgi:hypothetical protein
VLARERAVEGSIEAEHASVGAHEPVPEGRCTIRPVAFAPLLVIFVLSMLAMLAQVLWRQRGAVLARAGEVPASATPVILASDDEREAASAAISYAIGEGRLGLEEGLGRIDVALRARERQQLANLVADLPAVATYSGGRTLLHNGVLVMAGALVLAAVLVQVFAGAWELWPLALVVTGALTLVGHR